MLEKSTKDSCLCSLICYVESPFPFLLSLFISPRPRKSLPSIPSLRNPLLPYHSISVSVFLVSFCSLFYSFSYAILVQFSTFWSTFIRVAYRIRPNLRDTSSPIHRHTILRILFYGQRRQHSSINLA